MTLTRTSFLKRFSRLTVLQLFAITGLVAALAAVWKSSPIEEAIKQRRARVLNEQLFESISALRLNDARALLKKGANPNYARELTNSTVNPPKVSHESVLNVSIRLGDIPSMKLLLDAGANGRATLPVEPAEAVLLTSFDEQKQIDLLKVLFERTPDRPKRHMDLAIEYNKPVVVQFLKDFGYSYEARELALTGDVENLKAAEALTPGLIHRPVEDYQQCGSLLGIALLRGHQQLADWLLTAGSSLEVRDAHGATAMHLAASGKCDWIIAKLRAAGCDPNATDDIAGTPLNYAIRSPRGYDDTWNPETVQALIDAGADANYRRPQTGSLVDEAAMQYVSSGQTPDAKKILLLLLAAGGRPQFYYDLLPWISQKDRELAEVLQKLGLLNPPMPQISPLEPSLSN